MHHIGLTIAALGLFFAIIDFLKANDLAEAVVKFLLNVIMAIFFFSFCTGVLLLWLGYKPLGGNVLIASLFMIPAVWLKMVTDDFGFIRWAGLGVAVVGFCMEYAA